MKLLRVLAIVIVAVVAAGPAHTADTGQAAANKAIVMKFYDLLFLKGQVAEAFKLYVGPTYKQHNPGAPDGAGPAIAFLSKFVPGKIYEVKRVLADGDLVAVHQHFRAKPEDRGFAVVDIFRLENGKIVEHWDVIQAVPEKALNSNTMF